MTQTDTPSAASPALGRSPRNAYGILDGCFLFLLFLSFSFPLRITIGSFEYYTLPEIAAFLYIVWRFASRPKESAKPNAAVSFFLRACWLAVAWIAVLWLCASNWQDRHGPLLDWILAVTLLTIIVRFPPKIPEGIKRYATLFVLAALPNVIYGVVQFFIGSGLRHKDLLGWRWRAGSIPVNGFFTSPNDLAIFVFWSLLLAVGLAVAERRWNYRRMAFTVLAVVYGFVLFGTYSRLTLAAAICALAAFFLLPVLQRKHFLWLSALYPLSVVGVVVGVSQFYPIRKLLSHRLVLWQRTLNVIFQNPVNLLFGYLSSARLRGASIWWIPHNIYLLAWVEFGIVGFLGLVALAVFLAVQSWKHFESLRTNPLWAALTLALGGMMLIIGMGSLYLFEGFTLLTFFTLVALWCVLFNGLSASPEGSSTIAS
jgi:hypothetical protein